MEGVAIWISTAFSLGFLLLKVKVGLKVVGFDFSYGLLGSIYFCEYLVDFKS